MKKVLHIIVAISVLILPNGCTTSKLISIKEAPFYSKKKFLVLKTPHATYDLHSYKFTDEYLEGYLHKTSEVWTNVIKVETRNNLDVNDVFPVPVKIELKDITSITYKDFNLYRTLLLLIPVSLIAAAIILSVAAGPIAVSVSGAW